MVRQEIAAMSRALPSRLAALFLALSLMGAAPAPAAAEDAAAGIARTIQSQLDAFLADDVTTAFTFASPGIRQMFRTPERFGEMVRSGYPMVWRPGQVRYLERRELSGRIVQRVMIIDQQGGLHLLDYMMIRTDEGWQIAGVQLLAGGVGA
jgi:hypothetical protein